MARRVRIEPMAEGDWPEVRRIYAEGIATGDATFETEVPDWSHWDRLHRPRCRLVARDPKTRRRSSAGPRCRAPRRGGSMPASPGRASMSPTRGEAVASAARCWKLISASENAGYWTLQAGSSSRTKRAWPSTSVSASGGLGCRNGSGAISPVAGGTASCSNGEHQSGLRARRNEPVPRRTGSC